jgi:pyrimidine deaminase RibD-like protein
MTEPVYPPESIRPRPVHSYALALREKLRPSLSANTKEQRNHSALIYLKLLERELNPNCLPPQEQADFRGPVVAREAMTDLRDLCYALADVWGQSNIWSGASTATPVPLEMPDPPADLVARLADAVERLGAALLDYEPTADARPARTEPFEVNEWEVVEDAPAERISYLPPPAAGRFVVALSPPAVDGIAAMRGEPLEAACRPELALLWTNARGEQVLSPTGEGLLLGHHRGEATWLPDGWEMDVFPAGWTLAHVEAWFNLALNFAKVEPRGDIPAGSDASPSYLPTPRGLVTHAHLIVRHLGLPNSSGEPRGVLDRAGCIAELRDLLLFFRRSLKPSTVAKGGSEAPVTAGSGKCDEEHSPEVPTEIRACAAESYDASKIIARAQAVQKLHEEEARRLRVEADNRLRCGNAVMEYGKRVSDIFLAHDPGNRQGLFDPASFLSGIFASLANVSRVLRSCGFTESWQRVDREATFNHYRSGFARPDEAHVAFDWGCHLLDLAFRHELREEDILTAWQEPALRGSYHMVEILLNGMIGAQRIVWREDSPQSATSPGRGKAPNEGTREGCGPRDAQAGRAQASTQTPDAIQLRVCIDNDRGFMKLAIEEAHRSVGEDGRAHPKVGAVVVKDGMVLASAHRGELGKGEHAEYTALEKKLSTGTVAGATVYTTLEPCTTRNHPKIPCARRLIERKVKRVVIGMLDPNPDISGKGVLLLREHNVEIDLFPPDLMAILEELNRDFTRAQSQAAAGQPGQPR